MRAPHFEFLVEEPSMETFLAILLPRLIGETATYSIHSHQGKSDLLVKLKSRLRAYAKWLHQDAKIIVLVDRDDEDCLKLKTRLEQDAAEASLTTRTVGGGRSWSVLNRIAVEELEAWYFGEWASVRAAFPKAPASIPLQASYRRPDEIAGGTWEALERVLQRSGYFAGGLRKVEAARRIGQHFDPSACQSPSFAAPRDALVEAITV
jgi:hypothetical protein